MSLWPSEGDRRRDRVEVSIGHAVEIIERSSKTQLFVNQSFLRFLCGTCNISFKLDRTKSAGEDKKTEAKKVKNVSKRRKLKFLQDV